MSAEAGIAVLVFARAPLPGMSKTRLIPHLGADAAARLQERMTRLAIETACAADIGTVQLWCAPTNAHHTFDRYSRTYPISVHSQVGATLGERMLFAHDLAFQSHTRVILIGTDCPVMTASDLRAVSDDLSAQDAVIIPAQDGGYVLLGLAGRIPALFTDIAWGTNQVCAQTVARLSSLGHRYRLREPLWDVDRAEDYDRLAACLPDLVVGLNPISIAARAVR